MNNDIEIDVPLMVTPSTVGLGVVKSLLLTINERRY